MDPRYDIDVLLDEVVTLPSLPGTVAEIMRLVNDPNCPLLSVAKVLAADPPLAMKTLRLVNTAFYGLQQKVSTIEHAVALLGLKVVENLVFTATVFDIMAGDVDVFFRHSVSCGLAMQVFAEIGGADMPVSSSAEASVHGLLHDIGKIFLKEFLPEEMALVKETSRTRGICWEKAEREIIGFDHGEIGARLAQKWKLPAHFVEGIRGHHDMARCEQAEYRPVAAMLGVADYVCCQCGITAEEGAVVHLDAAAWAEAHIEKAHLPTMMNLFFEKLPSVDELINCARE
ncbi:MAG: HDOD domain-containing protein [Nitrospiraceae bacterium]|nr:HDOD domain-containing protein [Nitrospiraceae bacterium]